MFLSRKKFYSLTENKILSKGKFKNSLLLFVCSVIFECRDGKIQRCSRWIIKFSSYFSEKINESDSKEKGTKFDCSMYSHETIKLFLDIVHGINERNIPIVLYMDILVFLAADGKLGKFHHLFVKFIYFSQIRTRKTNLHFYDCKSKLARIFVRRGGSTAYLVNTS